MSQFTENPSDKPATPGELPPPQITLPPPPPRHSLVITLIASAIVAALVAGVLTLGLQAFLGNVARTQTLTQQGTVTVTHDQKDGVDVYYAVPYVSPPNLTLGNGTGLVVIVEQKPDHFKLRAADTTIRSDVSWKAEGVPTGAK
jgi:hypothetical protein